MEQPSAEEKQVESNHDSAERLNIFLDNFYVLFLIDHWILSVSHLCDLSWCDAGVS